MHNESRRLWTETIICREWIVRFAVFYHRKVEKEKRKDEKIHWISLFSSELLRECSVDEFQVEKNDIIILSSDGLWDVIKAPQLHQIMERNRDQVRFEIFKIHRFSSSVIFL